VNLTRFLPDTTEPCNRVGFCSLVALITHSLACLVTYHSGRIRRALLPTLLLLPISIYLCTVHSNGKIIVMIKYLTLNVLKWQYMPCVLAVYTFLPSGQASVRHNLPNHLTDTNLICHGKHTVNFDKVSFFYIYKTVTG
jgi:hypothetical protein